MVMNVKENLKKLWGYLVDNFELEEIETGFASAIEGFDHNVDQINDEYIDYLSEEDAKGLFFDTGYMAVNELFGGDFGTWYDVLEGNLGFDAETIQFLDF